MKSAPECFHYADCCERLGWDSLDRASRQMFFATAAYWRALGNVAKAKAAHEVQEQWPPE